MSIAQQIVDGVEKFRKTMGIAGPFCVIYAPTMQQQISDENVETTCREAGCAARFIPNNWVPPGEIVLMPESSFDPSVWFN